MTEFASMFDVLEIVRTTMIGTARNVVGFVVRSPAPLPDDEGAPAETESEDVEAWTPYGFVSKPPPGAEAFVLRLGRFVVSIASRVVETASVYGLLNDGDVGLYSVGKQVLRLNKDGSTTFLKTTASGEHLVITITKDDEIKVIQPGGAYIEATKTGLILRHDTAPVTISSGVLVQIVAPALCQEVGANKLHVGAGTPLIMDGAIPIANVWV